MAALLLVALAVGLDNFGAAGALGVSGAGSRRLEIAVVFGVFEAAMPLLGLLLGDSVAHGLGGRAKLVAGLVLCLAGIYASCRVAAPTRALTAGRGAAARASVAWSSLPPP